MYVFDFKFLTLISNLAKKYCVEVFDFLYIITNMNRAFELLVELKHSGVKTCISKTLYLHLKAT